MIQANNIFTPYSVIGEPMPALQKVRVACYIRVSTDDPAQEDSYEAQEKYFSKLLLSRSDWDSVGVYADYGISGTNKNKRTGLNRLLRHCEQGKVDRVICKSISRLSRNTTDTVAIIRRLLALGIACYFEKESLDTGDMKSEFILTTLAALAQEESRMISENLRWSFDKRAPRGDVPNFACYGYRLSDEIEVTETGYRRRKVVIIPEEAAVVKEIFTHYVDGLSMTDIVHILNSQNNPELNKNNSWRIGKISEILRNERYCGDVLTHKSYTADYLTHKVKLNKGEIPQFYIKDHHPAIISRELFQKAQAREKLSRSGSKKKEYPYSGRLVCAHCGKNYHIYRRNSSMLWICSGVKMNNGIRICDAEKISQVMLDILFSDAVKLRFPDRNTLLALLETTQGMDFAERDRGIMRKQIAILADELDSAKAAYEESQNRMEVLHMRHGIFGREFDITEIISNQKEQQNKITQIESEKAELEAELDKKERHWELLEKDYMIRNELIDFMKTANAKKLRAVLPKYVKALALSIIVHDPTHFTVHWFDGTETEITES